ncbi:MAG: CYTH domain-containing protein [Lysobacteraceae bacterium]
MGIEIERKFTVTGSDWRNHVDQSVLMAQGYLNDMAALRNGAQQASVRVRIAGARAFLNVKSRELGHTRQEFEYEIPIDDAQALLRLCIGGLIEKTRHYISQGALTWEVDVFEGENAGLIVAEIELPHADAEFEKPEWVDREVTDSLRYYNLALAERPYAQWLPEEKA